MEKRSPGDPGRESVTPTGVAKVSSERELQKPGSCCHQLEGVNRQVATATGESVRTINERGFVMLTSFPVERDRQPLVVDWDERDRRTRFPRVEVASA